MVTEMATTNGDLLAIEEKAIEEVTQMMKNYFQNHKEAVTNKELNIDKIEDLLLETREETERIMKKAMREALKSSETELIEKKKSAPGAKGES